MGLVTALAGMMTETDNRTHDLFRYLAVVSAAVGLCLEIYVVVWKTQPFDFQNFGIGVGVLFTGVGAALLLRPETKPSTTTTTTTLEFTKADPNVAPGSTS